MQSIGGCHSRAAECPTPKARATPRRYTYARLRIALSAANPTLQTDPALLEIVLDNLLGNAVAYAPADGVVDLSATPVAIEVRNVAPALHAEDLANFGQRFWRKDAQGAGHAGLGLALAAAAARALKMTLAFDLHDGALVATLTWRG